MKRLDQSERKILLDLIAIDRPRLSLAQVALKFEAIAGRKISRYRVGQVERNGYRRATGHEPEKYHARRLHQRIH